MRTLLDREGSDRPERRSALVDRELNRYNVDMAALSETRLADVGEAAEANYTFFWSGRAPHLKRETIKTSLVPKLIGKPKAINDSLMTAQFPLTKKHCATLISVYAPTMQYSDEDKEKLIHHPWRF